MAGWQTVFRVTVWMGRLSRRLTVRLPGHLEEIAQQVMAVFRGNRFGVELHAVDRALDMAKAHDFAVAGMGGGAQARWQGFRLDGERVIARRREGAGQAGEQAGGVMVNRAGLAVHDLLGRDDITAKGLADRLVTEADAEQGQVGGELADDVETDAGTVRITRAGRENNARRLQRQGLGCTHGVIADDARRRPQFLEIMHQVEGETVVIVDDQQHAGPPSRQTRAIVPRRQSRDVVNAALISSGPAGDMPSRSVKSIRPHNAAMPALAGAVVASAYLAAAVAFSVANAAPDRPIRSAAVAEPTVQAETLAVAAANEPGAGSAVPVPALDRLPAASAIASAEVRLPIAAPLTSGAIAGHPSIALIIDDVGLDAAAAARVLALDAPLTIAILPYAEAAAATALAARAGGRDVLVHVPMEPLGLDDPGPHALRVDLSDRDLRARIRWAMARVPGAIGLNNHMGSRFTGDPRALRVALGAIADQGPLFIDSMTIADSRGYAVAEGLGLPVLRRDIFLDHVIEAGAIRARLAEAETLARAQGHAVLIGHPHDATLEALESWIGEARAAGFDFVTVTALSAQLARAPAEQISASIVP